MIYTITFNPSIDYTMELDSFSIGAVNRARDAHMTPGGKGINVSVVLSTLGLDNRMLGFVAGFTGEALEQQLRLDGFNTDFIHLKEGASRINVKLCSESTTDINAPGPRISKTDLEILYSKLDVLTSGDFVVLAGAIPTSLPAYTYQQILERLAGRGVEAVIDATGELLMSTLSYRPFLIKPNRTELGELFSTRISTRSEVERYARTLLEKGARNVLVSLDSEGAVLLTEDGRTLHCPAPAGKVVNTVGAGDSMVAGFIYGWLSTGSYDEALKYAVAAGSTSAFTMGLPMASDIRSLYGLM